MIQKTKQPSKSTAVSTFVKTTPTKIVVTSSPTPSIWIPQPGAKKPK